MNIYYCQQRSDEWFKLRVGRITGTSFATMANGKTSGIDKLVYKTAAERVTGVSSDSGFSNSDMERGVELEAEARAAYEYETLTHVQEVGFIALDKFTGVSPDGLVGDDGGVEIKCPRPYTHMEYLSKGGGWKKYKWQVQGALWCSSRAWWDFVSYCPEFPAGKSLLIERVKPDAECFEKLEAGRKMLAERIEAVING